MEFRGFIGGFGKIFFTKGGIKREKGVWGDGEEIFGLCMGRDVIWNIP